MTAFEASLTEVYVVVDDLVKAEAVPPRPGPAPALSVSEVVVLAMLSVLSRFRSGRDFYRFAETQLRGCFPHLPHRTQFGRQVHRHAALIARIAVVLGTQLAEAAAFELLDCTAMPTRNVKRRGRGWMPGEMSVGYSNRLGYYEGAKVLTCVSPTGVLTGFGFAPANEQDRVLAEEFLARRCWSDPMLPSAGRAQSGIYVADQGFGGQALERRYASAYHATLVCPPQRGRTTRVWPKPLRQWLIRLRQPIETVHDHLITVFRLDRSRPHLVTGAFATLAAMGAMHNCFIWLNRRHGRPDLAFADVIPW